MFGKAALLEAIAGKNRGILATETDRQAIQAAIVRLEERNPTPEPLQATELLDGNWRLLYTTSQELLRIDLLPLFKLGQIYQYVRTATAQIYNIAEISGVPYLEGFVSVAARFEPFPDESLSQRRVKVNFERSILGLQRLVNYQSPEAFIEQIDSGKKFTAIDFPITQREQKGWLEITYLDEDLRIGRGNEGNVFVLTKVK
ncbi:PAP/fibrillin family protein [Leptolyngbya ohadii]|uniref:PAP/fibrillin family protein n=1 Tax=Leptolyngbya ohadii TaxID=1962290 RepID=UPI000B59C749|nr:PAP/fibrillin family protein [Leptolyngbya ohadii]